MIAPQFKVIPDIRAAVWDQCDYVVRDGQLNPDIELGKIHSNLPVVKEVSDGIPC